MKFSFKPVEDAAGIASWETAIAGRQYLGYERLYFRGGQWSGRWFTASGDTHPFGSVCIGLTEEEVEFLNDLVDEIGEKWSGGCDWKMMRDLNDSGCRVREHIYLLEAEGGPCKCLMCFTTEFGNGDYPIRAYLYR